VHENLGGNYRRMLSDFGLVFHFMIFFTLGVLCFLFPHRVRAFVVKRCERNSLSSGFEKSNGYVISLRIGGILFLAVAFFDIVATCCP